MEYTHLTQEQRKEMLRGRLIQLEAEHFNHEISKKIAKKLAQKETGEKKQQAQAEEQAAKDAQGIIEAAYSEAKSEFDALP